MATDALTVRSRSAVPALLAAAVIGLQIGYPLLHGASRDRWTLLIVVTFAAASGTHAVLTRGLRIGGAVTAIAGLGGFAVELVGVHTGVPFGHYAYGSALGPRLLGVPLALVPAWAMLAWPAALVARRLVSGRVARVLVGGWALAAWDLFLDPQMVSAGAWRWRGVTAHLPGVDAVPLSNTAGWLAVAVVLSAAIQWLLRDDPGGRDGVPVALYLWTWAASTVALGVFLGLPAAAAWGALGMGVVAVPLLRTLPR